LGESPQRARDIEAFHIHLKNCAAASIPSSKYALTILSAMRSGAMRSDAYTRRGSRPMQKGFLPSHVFAEIQ
jgi:hypothetical protein